MARSSTADPLERFRFTLNWSADASSEGTAAAAGFHDIQMPKRSTNVGNYREGIDADINQLFAGLSTMDPITLSRGLLALNDANNQLYKWMSAVHNPSAAVPGGTARPANAAAADYRKDVTITMLDREGGIARRWKLYNAWPSNFVPGSDLDASEDGDKSLESLTLSYEDFQEVKAAGTPAVSVSPQYAVSE